MSFVIRAHWSPLPRRQRPSRCASEPCNELPPPHLQSSRFKIGAVTNHSQSFSTLQSARHHANDIAPGEAWKGIGFSDRPVVRAVLSPREPMDG
jgi:hypothetical protein